MKFKTATLNGTALDWAVAMALGIPAGEIRVSGFGKCRFLFRRLKDEDGNLNGCYRTGPELLFSSKWEAGGAIIERELITTVARDWAPAGMRWSARIHQTNTTTEGATPLIAAMRCYVASKLGDEVEVLEERAMTAPELLKAEMPLVRQCEANLQGYGYIKGTPEWHRAFSAEIAYYRKFGPPTKDTP